MFDWNDVIRRHAWLFSCVCLLFIFISVSSKAQVNYVRNASLEDYSSCPDMVDAIFDVYYWSALDSSIDSTSIIYGRPEYCNACAGSNTLTGIPNGGWFYHYPHSGNGLAQVQMFL